MRVTAAREHTEPEIMAQIAMARGIYEEIDAHSAKTPAPFCHQFTLLIDFRGR